MYLKPQENILLNIFILIQSSVMHRRRDDRMDILFVAAENDALNGAKVGGLGDVIGSVGHELAKQGCRVTTVLPSYGFVHKINPAEHAFSINFYFRGFDHHADFYKVMPKTADDLVYHLVVDHPALAGGGIYADDPPDRPFATDANRFSFFCTAVASALMQQQIALPDCIHLHDWHTAFFLILRKFHPYFAPLKPIRMVYTIHNLALQGIRPFRGDDSALAAWFPGMDFDWMDLHDPRWIDCLNPMAAGIRLADAVHTVSPSYAEEILHPSRKPDVLSGGEGLEFVLQHAKNSRRLHGILNGCTYPDSPANITTEPDRQRLKQLSGTISDNMPSWLAGKEAVPTAHFLAHQRLPALDAPPTVLLTSVGRLTDQKTLLLRSEGSSGKTAIEEILSLPGLKTGVYILLGTGDRSYERFFSDISARFHNFIFLNGYSDACADALYKTGNLFLMPSSFEPCGISQMFAMREGQPCVVHHVGGLKDTVRNEENGFAFAGATLSDQVDSFVAAVKKALTVRTKKPAQWKTICRQAASERFSWQDCATRYMEDLYQS